MGKCSPVAVGLGDNRDYERDMSCDGFPPKISFYVRADTHNQLEIVFNCGRDKAWRQAMQELHIFVIHWVTEAMLNFAYSTIYLEMIALYSESGRI